MLDVFRTPDSTAYLRTCITRPGQIYLRTIFVDIFRAKIDRFPAQSHIISKMQYSALTNMNVRTTFKFERKN